MTAWGRTLLTAFIVNDRSSVETPLMRMFRIEYANEYRQMKRLGCEFNDSTIKAFMDSNR